MPKFAQARQRICIGQVEFSPSCIRPPQVQPIEEKPAIQVDRTFQHVDAIVIVGNHTILNIFRKFYNIIMEINIGGNAIKPGPVYCQIKAKNFTDLPLGDVKAEAEFVVEVQGKGNVE